MIVRKDPFLQGAIDFHIHSGPDTHPRYASCLEIARQSREAGMRAIVLKDQMTQSIHKAYFVNKYVGGIQAFGGITLNRMVGGYDIRTVEFACRLGAKVIWFATHDSGYTIESAKKGHYDAIYVKAYSFGYPVEPLGVLNKEKTDLLPEVKRIIDTIVRNKVVLQTAHIDPGEALAVARYCKQIGYNKLVVTHVNSFLDEYTDDIIAELIRHGAMIELSYSDMVPRHARQDPHVCARLVDKFGPKYCILESDLGTWENVSPTEGLRCFCHYLVYCGVPAEYINIMVKENPARLLDLDS
jgi:hypothetical protein